MVARYYKDRTSVSFAVSAIATAQNQFTEPAEFAQGPVNISVGGSGWSATVTLQRSFDGGDTWRDVWDTTEPTEQILDAVEARVLWRIGVKTGDYGSGNIALRLSQ